MAMSRKEGGKELKEGRKDKMNRREERRKKLNRRKEETEEKEGRNGRKQTFGVSTLEKGHVQHLRVRAKLLHGTVGEGGGVEGEAEVEAKRRTN